MSRSAPDEVHRLRREIAAIALITAAALTFASLLYGAHADTAATGGYLPHLIASALTLSFGVGAFAVPLVLLVVGVLLALERPQIASARALAGAGMLFAVILTAVAMAVPPESRFDPEGVVLNGGYLGATLAWAFLGLLGPVGSYIVLGGIALAALVLLTQTSVQAVLQGAGRLVHRTASATAGTFRDGMKEIAQVARRSAPSRGRGRGEPRSRRPDRAPVVELDLEQAESACAPDEPTGTSAQPRRASRAKRPPKTEGAQTVLLAGDDLYTPPPLSLLSDIEDESLSAVAREEATENIIKLEDTLESFGVQAKVVAYEQGPVITRYEVEPAPGIRVGKIVNLSDDLAMAGGGGCASGPGQASRRSGSRCPTSPGDREPKRLPPTRSFSRPLPAVGAAGLRHRGPRGDRRPPRMPHLLVAGASNSGASVCLHTIICSILMRARPNQVKFILIDPKRVELRLYDGIPHLMAPVVYSPKEAADALRKVIREMDKRYDQFAMKGVVNIDEYNELAARPKEHSDQEFEPIPHVVIVIDELADLMMQARAEFEFSICRLAQLARATGIHLVLATQRPSVNVITGTIKANIPSRVALAVTSQHDSRTILDGQGAERLIGRGDMLYAPIDENQPRRLQGAFIPRADLQRVVDHLCRQGEPEYEIIPQLPEDDEDFAGELEVSDKLYAAAVVIGEAGLGLRPAATLQIG